MTDTTDKQAAKLQVSSRAVVKRFLIILIPLAVLLGGIASIFYYSAVGKERIKFETNELNIVTHQVNMIEREFKMIISDLVFLSGHHELKEMLAGDDAVSHKETLAEGFFSFAKARKIYDQIRFFDETGMEVIRVNFGNGKPYVVPENQLQSKVNRYYFQESMTHDEEEIYVSQFDLNMEHGEIEQPLKPMIRYGTPVFDRHGNKSGVLLLNYLGANLLQGFKTAGADSLGQAMLLNSDGFWLNGARSEDEWGFMFEERKNRSYKTAFPKAWQKISATESGQFYTADGVFTYMTVYPLLAADKTSAGPGEPLMATGRQQGDGMRFWKVVSYVPNPVLTAESRKTLDSVISLYAFVMVLFAIGAWFLARAGVIRNRAEAERKRALAELADSEYYNRMLFEQSPIGLALCRMNGELVDINPAYARILGRSVEETLLLSYWDITPENYAEDEQRQLESLNKTGRYSPYEKEYIHKDGHLVPVHLQGLLLEKDGEQMVWSSVEDITERLEAQKALQEREQNLAVTLNSIGDAVITTDAEGHITRMNPVAEQLTGWSLGDAQGQMVKSVFSIVNASTCEPIENLIDKVISTGETVCLSNCATLISRDGTEYRVADSAAPIIDSGHILGMVLVFNDVTEQYQLREAVAKSQQNLQTIMDNSPAIIYTKDIKGRYIFVNNEWEQLFDKKNEGIIGKTDYEIFPKEFADGFSHNDKAVLMAGHALKLEETAPHDDGPHAYVSAKFPLFDEDGNAYAVCAISTDISERKQQEEQIRRTQKMDALGKLTGGVAHDYNNALGIILGYAGLLENMLSEQPELADYVKEIRHAGERGAKLTKKLLSFTRQKSSDAAMLNINTQLLDEQNILEKTLTARIKLVFDLAEDLWPTYLDSGELEDAIINISINAMHAIEGEGQLTIQTCNITISDSDAQLLQTDIGDYVLINMIDTGCGMDEKTKDKIFEPFYSTKGEQGTGLGLSQVYGFVKSSGGVIKVYSELGHGTRLTMYFPRYHEESNSTDNKLEQINDEAPLGGIETVLIVDDEPALVNLTSNILSQQGYRVICANSGKQALEVIEHEPIDLLLTDIIMPEMDGYQLASIVQEKYPAIKIQLASGFTDDRHVNMTDDSLHTNLLHKPYYSETLLIRIRELLGKEQSRVLSKHSA